jgi:hypothetical protein
VENDQNFTAVREIMDVVGGSSSYVDGVEA